MVLIVTNGEAILCLVEGDYEFCLSMVCISKVGVTRACGLDSLQLVLGVIPRGGVSYGVFLSHCWNYLSGFETTCRRIHSWEFVVCMYLCGDYRGLMVFQF